MKLEPLSVEEALSSPAVEGMFSFLDIRPDELLRARPLSEVVSAAVPFFDGPHPPQRIHDLSQAHRNPAPDPEASDVSGIRTNSTPGLKLNDSPGLNINHDPGLISNTSPGITNNDRPGFGIDSNNPTEDTYQLPNTQLNTSYPTPGLTLDYRPGSIHNNNPGLDTITRPGLTLNQNPQGDLTDQPPHHNASIIAPHSSDRIHGPGQELSSSPGLILDQTNKTASSENRHSPTALASSALQHATAYEANFNPHLGSVAPEAEISLLVRQVRYTIRRARLVQDGHTSNEQKLYEYLWTHGAPHDDLSRRVSIGFRTLAEKVRMARASAQKNLRALAEKLALEVIEAFDVTCSKAATYRVFNYIEILRRRELAGMTWYVRRTQAVRFVDAEGHEIIGRNENSPGLELHNSPGPIFMDDPGPLLTPQPGGNISREPGLELGPHYREQNLERTQNEKTSSSPIPLEPPSAIADSLTKALPGIDYLALQTLWTECRHRVTDCTSEEVLYFTNQKLSIARNGKIQNPVGFLISVVPKCFEGQTFQIFRQEQARRREEQQRREEEERERWRRLEEETRREAESYRKAEETLLLLSEEDRRTLYDRVKEELKTKFPRINWPNRQVLEDRIRIGMIRELQKQT